MNTSPFEIFRRNLKPLMVLLTGLALFAFVVLPVVDSYMRRSAESGGERVVATYNGKSLTQNRVDYFTRNHNETVGFLSKLADATIERGGIPRTAGFQYDPQSKRVLRIGINQNPGDEVTVRTLMFAAEANREGFELDDSAIQSWLDRYTDGMMTDSEITAMLMKTTQNRMGRPHLYEQLRSHLLADVYLKRGYAGLYSGDNPSAGALMTPAEQWSAFVKLNRSATADVYGVLVNDYLEQTSENQPQELILATYQEGKDRDVSDLSPDPAFHRRYTASFEYLEGDLKKFMDEEAAKLTEEEILAEYERQVAGGAFQMPNEDLEQLLEANETTPEQDPSGSTDSSETVNDMPAEEAPAEEAPAEEAPAEEAPAEEAPAEEAPAEEAPAEEAPGEQTPSAGDQSSVTKSTSVRLVALQDQEAPTSDEPAGEASAETEPETPAVEETTDAGEKPVDDEKPASDEQPVDDSETAAAPPADPAKDPSAAEEQEKMEEAPKEDAQEQTDAMPKVKPLEEVREQLIQQMTFPAAQKRLDDAADRAFKEMQTYFTQKAIHESNLAVGQAGEPPVKPDLKALADEIGFEFKTIGPYDQVSIASEPIATSMDSQTPFGNRGPNFTLMMYGYALGQNVFEPKEKFTPLETTDPMAGKIYVSWKVDDRQAYTPSLEEVTDEVVRYLRMKEAKALAQAEAERIAKAAAEQSDKSLADLIPEDKQENLKTDLGPFKWLDSFGRGVTMGNVPQLDAVGEEFMAAVFEADVDQYRIAANEPERVIYIVKPTNFEPSVDELRQQFRQPKNRAALAAIDPGIGSVLGEFYESIDKKAGFADLTVTEQ